MNILLDKNFTAKVNFLLKKQLGDLSESRILLKESYVNSKSRVGTPQIFSPEIIKLEKYDHRVFTFLS
jgi:serine/threonine protein kinase